MTQRPAWMVVVGLVVVPWLAWPRGEHLDGHHLVREAALALIGVVALVIAARRPRAHDALDDGVLAVALVSTLSGALAIDPWTGLRLAGVTLAAAAALWTVREVDPAGRRRLLGFTAAGLATWAIGESLGWWPTVGAAYGRAPCGPLSTRNELAHVLALALACWLSAELPEARWPRVLEWGALALVAAGLVVSRSRAAWVSSLAAVMVTLALARHVAWPRLVAALAGAAAGVLLPTRLAWRAPHPLLASVRTLLDASTGSGAGRVQQALTSARLLPEAPVLGVGPGHWAVHYPRIAAPGDPTIDLDALEPVGRLMTSDAVAVWVERGIAGGLLTVVAAGAAVLAWKQANVSPALRVGSLAGAAALLGLTLFDSVLSVAATLAALVVALAPPRSREATGHASKPWLAGVAAAALVAVLGARAADLRAFTWRSGAHASLEDLERAAAASPGDFLSRAQLAEAHVLRGSCAAAGPWLDAALKRRPWVRYLERARVGCRANTPRSSP